MCHALMSKCRLTCPQWIELQEKTAGRSKYIRPTFHLMHEEETIVLDNRNKTVRVIHEPAILVPVLNVNPGIRNLQDF